MIKCIAVFLFEILKGFMRNTRQKVYRLLTLVQISKLCNYIVLEDWEDCT
jgi:hypothetical protein